jgi:hypothetical protein
MPTTLILSSGSFTGQVTKVAAENEGAPQA